MKKYKKKKYNKFLSFIILLLMLILIFYLKGLYNNYQENKRIEEFKESFIKNKAYLDNYAIYGTNLWISGHTDVSGSLVITDGKKETKIDDVDGNFKTEFINSGVNLEKIKSKKSFLVIRSGDKLYSLQNKTNYPNLKYYTMTKNNMNYLIKIKKDFEIDKKFEKMPDNYYDIIIDPGHGKIDIGSSTKLKGKTYNEADLNLKVAQDLKQKLENKGFKVKMTRNKKEDIATYGPHSRTAIPYENHAKLVLSIHNNSFDYEIKSLKGYEIFVSNDNNLKLAKKISKNLNNIATPSTSNSHKIDKGIYQRLFTKNEILEERPRYNLNTNTPYYYMIREVGGISTNASSKKINNEYQNKYYNKNIGAESLLLELAYMNNEKDLSNLINNYDKYASNIANAINEFYRGDRNEKNTFNIPFIN